jgi:ligand-binding sensor domain-containing protein
VTDPENWPLWLKLLMFPLAVGVVCGWLRLAETSKWRATQIGFIAYFFLFVGFFAWKSIIGCAIVAVVAVGLLSISDLIRIVLGPTLCLCLVVSVFQSLCLANQAHPQEAGPQVSINPPIRLPIVDATDNRFLHLSAAEGVSQTKVDHMVQDNQGFVWFGTRYGLYRYDGYTLKVFVREPGNPNSLDGVSIRALFKDRDGALWVGCDQSLNKFDPTTESFVRYPIPLTTHITQDSAGLLWSATSGGLYRLDPASGGIQHYSHDPNNPSSLSSNDISYFGQDRKGTLWVASPAGLDEFDRRSGKITRHIILPDVANGFQFHEDRFGVFWILHASPNALAVFDRKTNTLTNYEFPKRGPSLMKASEMLEDRNGALWIATHGLGLLKLDREQGKFVRYLNIPAEPESLPQNKIDALLADRDGNIWVAPGRLPPALLVTKPPQFNKLPKVPGSTIEPFVGALFEDREGILWIGTPEALIRRDRTGRITEYRTGGREVGSDVISICEDRSGSLWVGTYSHGLHRFDWRTGKFKTYRHDPADPYSLSNDVVMRLLVDHNGTLWAGTADGLNRFDAVTEHFTTYKLEPQSGVLCLELVEDREGKIWIGTESSGLHHFDPATGQFAAYKHDRDVPGTLSDHRVNSVHFDRSGTMWVGTQNGLDKFDPQTGSFSAFTQRDGLPGNAVGCILEDNNRNLWMSTNNGVAQFDSESKTFRNFSTAEGLPGPNLTGWGACFQSPSGEMFFGGFNGGTSFFPDTVMDSSYAPPIVLTDFRLFGNPVQVGDQSPLRRSISFTKDLILSHQQNVFSITLSALSYASPATNRYKYKLSNLERDWNEVGSDRRQAIYTTLPPGTYTFRAQGATRGGPWSEPGVALRIEILPPWWRTRPFQAAVSSLLLVMAWVGYRQRLLQVARQFEARLAERTRIARELHDTLLQSFQASLVQMQVARNLFSRRPEQAVQNLDSAIKMSAGAIAEGRGAIQQLRSEPAAHGDLPQLLTVTGQELARSNETSGNPVIFRVVVEGEKELKPLLQDEVYRIGRELLRNAFEHSQASEIEAEVRYEKRLLRVQVRDNGKGIDPEILNVGGRAGHWGLAGMSERAKQIGARLDFWSEAGKGTEAKLTVPASVAYRALRKSWRFSLVFKKVAST